MDQKIQLQVIKILLALKCPLVDQSHFDKLQVRTGVIICLENKPVEGGNHAIELFVCFLDFGGGMSTTTLVLDGSTSIPLVVIMWPKNLVEMTSNTHLFKLNIMLYW